MIGWTTRVLVQSDYFLFSNVKKWLSRKRFGSKDKIVARTNKYWGLQEISTFGRAQNCKNVGHQKRIHWAIKLFFEKPVFYSKVSNLSTRSFEWRIVEEWFPSHNACVYSELQRLWKIKLFSLSHEKKTRSNNLIPVFSLHQEMFDDIYSESKLLYLEISIAKVVWKGKLMNIRWN